MALERELASTGSSCWNREVNMNPQQPALTRGCRRKKTAKRGGFLSILAERASVFPASKNIQLRLTFPFCDNNLGAHVV